MTDTRCTFCAIIAGHVPADIVQTWPDSIAFRPLDPVNDDHLLVVPRRHARDFGTDPFVAAATAARASELVDAMGGDWNVIVNIGHLAGQSVFHLHLHLIGRTANDGLLFPWSHQQKTRCGHARDAHTARGCTIQSSVLEPNADRPHMVKCPCRYAAADMTTDTCRNEENTAP